MGYVWSRSQRSKGWSAKKGYHQRALLALAHLPPTLAHPSATMAQVKGNTEAHGKHRSGGRAKMGSVWSRSQRSKGWSAKKGYHQRALLALAHRTRPTHLHSPQCYPAQAS